MPGAFSWDGGVWPSLWGLCSAQGTAPLDKAAVKEDCAARGISQRMSESSQRQHSQSSAKKKDYLELFLKGAEDEGSQEDVG